MQVLLAAELATLMQAAQSASAAATHEEAKPENQYDTRGLEASYLAGAQSERVKELQGALHRLKFHPLRDFGDDDAIGPSAVVEVESDGVRSFCFLILVGAGLSLSWDAHAVLTVTTQSPLGRALVGKRCGDWITVPVGAREKDYQIVAVR